MGLIYDISIDPGLNSTGVCIWVEGKVKDLKPLTVRPKGKDLDTLGKCFSIRRQVVELFSKLIDVDNQIRCIAVEKFEGFNRQVDNRAFNKKAMISCATIKGILLGVADDWAAEVIEKSKRSITKEETARLALFYGLQKCSADARDAFQVGVCAGFDSPRRRL